MRAIARWLVLIGLAGATPAWAGPPFDTDDPMTTDYRHWQIYSFGTGSGDAARFDGYAALDINYGAGPRLEVTATLPAEFTIGKGGRIGAGDLQFASKYRFVQDDRLGLSIAIAPRVFLPTAAGGSGKVGALLPVWAEEDRGKWSLFGGGGLEINPGAGNRNYWTTGVGVTRTVTKRLQLGVEATHLGRSAVDAPPVTTLGAGAIYRLGGPVTLLAAAGPSFAGHDGPRYHAYLGLNFAF